MRTVLIGGVYGRRSNGVAGITKVPLGMYIAIHANQLSLLPSSAWKINTSQSAMVFCG